VFRNDPRTDTLAGVERVSGREFWWSYVVASFRTGYTTIEKD